MQDFVFGTLATDELRTEFVRARRAGVTHAHARQPRDPLPDQPVIIELTVGPRHPFDQARVEWMVEQNPGFSEKPGFWNVSMMELVDVEWDVMLWGYVRRFRITLPGQPAGSILRYRLVAFTSGGGEVYADDGAEYACYIDNDPTPTWTQDALIYHIFVDRFNPGQGRLWKHPTTPAGFYGGTLPGITEKLDYICTLGANVIWLSPIFPSPSHHGYDATDLFEIEPRLGTKEDLRQLLDQAHACGIRVLLDLVPNHWSSLHTTFQDAVTNPASPYRSWYNFTHWPDQYETFFGVRELPQLNLTHPAARQHMLEAVKYWLEFGVDGYRVDYALGPAPSFWAYFRQVIRSTKPDAWTFGEVVEPSETQRNFEGGLDGCLDFILLEGLRRAFAFGTWNASQLADFLTRHEAFFPASFSRPSFLDNHDMNRFLWAAENKKPLLRLAALCQFTLSGQPIVYYGTEVGLSQERDVRQNGRGLPEESRLPMLWENAQDTDLLDYYCKLASLRHAYPALRQPGIQVLYADENLLAYTRQALLVCLNLGNQTGEVCLPEPFTNPHILLTANHSASLHSLENGGLTVSLPPLSGVIITA